MATVGELAALVGGTVVGDAGRNIEDVADLASARAEHVSFLANPKYRDQFFATHAGAVLVAEALENAPTTQVICAAPYLALAQIAMHLHPAPSYAAGVEPGAFVAGSATVDPTATVRVGAVVDDGATIGPRTVIGAGAYVGLRASVGADTLLYPGVRILERCRVGDRVILHAGVVIGSDGFGYAPDPTGKRHKIPQVGIVVLEDDVEIGANSTVDRATFGETRIGAGSKIDNLVQIAHNVVLGKDCVIVSQTGVAGSARLGDRVIVGAQGGIAGHLSIANDVMLGARAGVASTISEAGVYSGVPAYPHRQWLRSAIAAQTLPELRTRVRDLEKRLEALEKERKDSPG